MKREEQMLEDVECKPSFQQSYRVGETRIGVQGYQGSQSWFQREGNCRELKKNMHNSLKSFYIKVILICNLCKQIILKAGKNHRPKCKIQIYNTSR